MEYISGIQTSRTQTLLDYFMLLIYDLS